MKLHLTQSDKRIHIKSVHSGGITIDDRLHAGSILISAATGVVPWRPQSLTTLEMSDFDAIVAAAPEIVLLGTGAAHRWPAARLLGVFAEHKMGVEVMTTAAACRTFNVLAGEGRDVFAALLAIDAGG